jgi:hypothetical protein
MTPPTGRGHSLRRSLRSPSSQSGTAAVTRAVKRDKSGQGSRRSYQTRAGAAARAPAALGQTREI